MPGTIRTFVAVVLPGEVKDLLRRAGEDLARRGVRCSWVKPGAMHLTLKFLGDVGEDRVPEIAAALDRAAAGFGEVRLSATGLGAFPGVKNARVVWAGVGGETDRLAALAGRVEEELEAEGFPREGRPFKAHLTIGRARNRPDPGALAEWIAETGNFSPPAFAVREIILYKSDLKPTGAVYTALHRAAL